MGRDPLEAVKRKVYFAALILGLPAILLLWVTYGPTSSFFLVVFALFATFCLACAWALWSWILPIRLVERATFAGGAAFSLVQLAYLLYSSGDLAGARTAITETSYLTLTVLYVAAHLVFDSRTALRVSLALYGTGLAMVLLKVVSQIPSGVSMEEVAWVIRLHAFMGAVITLTYASSYIKDDLLQQRAVAAAMHRLAHTDQLTGIANRRQLYSELLEETEKSERHGRTFSVILFDLDHFKHVNDTRGHDCGDVVLREVVRVMKPVLRKADRLGRWGGEEFIILAPETVLHQANRLAERLRESIASHESASTPGVTASFGIAQYGTNETPKAFIKRADQALYRAKALGRNRVERAA